MQQQNRVVIEAGSKIAFASAIDWPGWSRSAKTEESALDALRHYSDRYQRVAAAAGLNGVEAIASFDVVEHLDGIAVTAFGPMQIAACESEPMPASECERQIKLLRACWETFDATAARVSEEIRIGPRGGGRDLTKLIAHVFEAERSYARKIGVRTEAGSLNTSDGLHAHREAICEAIRDLNGRDANEERWPVRYFIRRAAWHVLDHAWEMEDKDLTGDANGSSNKH
jgi:hypothetical protein